jgi:hypothetical protein
MSKVIIRPFNVVDNTGLPEIEIDGVLTDGDPIEVEGELYFVCEISSNQHSESGSVGVIPLVVRNPAKVRNIKSYIECLSIAHRKVQFKNKKGNCELENCDEMIIT